MKRLVIVGTGAIAAELSSAIEDSSFGKDCNLEIKGYLEYEYNIEKYWKHYGFSKPVLGDLDSYAISDEDRFVVAFANVSFRKKVIAELKAKGAKFINIIHPNSVIAKTAQMGEGNIIYQQCIVGPKVTLGDFNILTSQSIISHDCVVGNNNFLPTTLLCGHVIVGNDNRFGIRSTVIPDVVIGNQNTIQSGMIVDKNVEDDTTVFYRFKEKVIAVPKP